MTEEDLKENALDDNRIPNDKFSLDWDSLPAEMSPKNRCQEEHEKWVNDPNSVEPFFKVMWDSPTLPCNSHSLVNDSKFNTYFVTFGSAHHEEGLYRIDLYVPLNYHLPSWRFAGLSGDRIRRGYNFFYTKEAAEAIASHPNECEHVEKSSQWCIDGYNKAHQAHQFQELTDYEFRSHTNHDIIRGPSLHQIAHHRPKADLSWYH